MEESTQPANHDLQVGIVVILASVVGFVGVAHEVFHGPFGTFDTWVTHAIVPWRTPACNVLFSAITVLGNTRLLLLVSCAVVLTACVYRPIRWEAVCAMGLLVMIWLISTVLKDTYVRPRPDPTLAILHETSFSFPSGHAMVSISLFGFIAYLAFTRLRGWTRAIVVTVFCMLIPLVGFSRIYVGVHYVGDVTAGYIAGLPVLVTTLLVYRRRASTHVHETPSPNGKDETLAVNASAD